MALVAAEGCRIQARFVGFGEQEALLRGRLDELVAASGGRLSAEIVDGRPAGAVRSALSATDVLLTASAIAADGDAETLGLVNLEAQAMGVPVVAAASGGVPEAVGAGAGVLVTTGENPARDLAQGLLDVLRRPEDWSRIGNAGAVTSPLTSSSEPARPTSRSSGFPWPETELLLPPAGAETPPGGSRW